MKIFAIRDEADKEQKDLAYLLYYETEKLFYIELPDDADPWETPLLLSSFAKRGEKTVNSYWSKLWVQQRIVPTERQNLGQILKENGLKEYDEYRLLMLSMGRCAQDDCYLIPMEEGELPMEIQNRFFLRIEDIIPLEDYHLLVFFRNGKVKKCSLRERFQSDNAFRVLLRNEELFCHVQMQTGGYGVAWDINRTISDAELYQIGKDVPLSAADFKNFVVHRVVTAAEAAEILGCSRQNIDDLTKRGKLHPIKTGAKTTLFLKSEILKRNWQ
jgi:predicted DNA-binding transcriptional regulator AlpA